jgi:predicted nucleic-acid-binding Zn-ribbon protein
MGMDETKKCPKCGGEMMHGDVTRDVRILKQGDFVGDKVYAFYYRDCGFVELYKEPSTKEPWRMQKQKEARQEEKPQPLEEKTPSRETPRKRLIR